MKNKRGLQSDYLGWILIALGVLVLALTIMFFNKDVISSILSGLKF